MNDEFIKAPIYKKYQWPVVKDSYGYRVSDTDKGNILNFFRNGNKKLKTYCTSCQSDESFTSIEYLEKTFRTTSGDTKIYNISYGVNSFFELFDDKLYMSTRFIGRTILCQTHITCNLNDEHNYTVYFSVTYDKDFFTITKIGQNVSPYEIGLPESKTYEKQLKKFDSVDDYRRVFIHRVHGDNIAALLYLRRVFEKMVNMLLDKTELKDKHFESKIKKLKEEKRLNPDVDELTKSVYDLLSKGIHELTNDECTKLFTSLNLFIDMQLLYIKTEQEKKDRLQELKGEISNNHSKYI